MQLDYIRSFVEVVTQASVTKAAAALRLSKSTVSEHIRALERSLGTQLLLTTTRKISLTPVGRSYYEQCAATLAELEAAGERARKQQSQPLGTLKISAPVEMAVYFLGPHLLAFSNQYPALRIELDLSSRNIDLRAEGFDIALRLGVIDDADLVVRPLATFERHLFASPAYLERTGRPAMPADLHQHRCLVFPRLGETAIWKLTRGRQAVNLEVGGPVSVNNLSFVFEAIVSGFGIGILPQFISEKAEAEGLICKVLPEWAVARSNLSAVTPTRHVLARTQVFIEFLKARLNA